jgi:hypothetical protein
VFSLQPGTPTKIKERTTVEEDKKVKVGTKRKVADEEEARSHKSPKKKKKKKEESGYGSSLQLDDVRDLFVCSPQTWCPM